MLVRINYEWLECNNGFAKSPAYHVNITNSKSSGHHSAVENTELQPHQDRIYQ